MKINFLVPKARYAMTKGHCITQLGISVLHTKSITAKIHLLHAPNAEAYGKKANLLDTFSYA